jgi:tRNA (guanine9-N1)-methyltransferase
MSHRDEPEPQESSSTGQDHQEATTETIAPGPSKKALKKAAKDARFQAAKLERRAREKEAKKEKKRILAEKRAAGELDDDDEEQKRSAKRRKLDFGGRVVVDLGFDEKMNPKVSLDLARRFIVESPAHRSNLLLLQEVKSLCSQLAYTYSTNRLANFPFSLIFSSLDQRTRERLDSIGDASYRRWAKSEWWTEGLERLWADSPTVSSSDIASDTTPASEKPVTGSAAAEKGPDEGLPSAEDVRQKVVYLTADCDEELTELKPDEIYVIGGIVDHNRYKVGCSHYWLDLWSSKCSRTFA